MAADPLIYQDPAPARTAGQLLSAMGEIADGRAKLAVPLLALHGTADKLTNPEGSRVFVAHAGSRDKTLKLYEGLYHDLLHEPERARVLADLEGWLDAHAR
jgi:alpha-beta hydrolase superfamily lysophospholipase